MKFIDGEIASVNYHDGDEQWAGTPVMHKDSVISDGTYLAQTGDSEYNFNLSAKTDFEDNNIFNIKSEVKRHIGKYNIFGLYKHEYYNNKEDFQFKVGVGIQL